MKKDVLRKLARVGLQAISEASNWRVSGGYDGPIAPNAAMERIVSVLRDTDLRMGEIEAARLELEEKPC